MYGQNSTKEIYKQKTCARTSYWTMGLFPILPLWFGFGRCSTTWANKRVGIILFSKPKCSCSLNIQNSTMVKSTLHFQLLFFF